MSLKDEVEALEMRRIADALAGTQFNVTKAAERLGMSRTTLHSKIKKYQIHKAVAIADLSGCPPEQG